jgi:hypothetical protein
VLLLDAITMPAFVLVVHHAEPGTPSAEAPVLLGSRSATATAHDTGEERRADHRPRG